MIISDILTPECIRIPLQATDKIGVITELVDLIASCGRLRDRDAVLDAVLTREQTRSTGIGEGLAVPHGKSKACDALAMAVGKPAVPLDFDSIDGRPVELVILLTSPVDTTGPHIQALGRISRLWRLSAFRRAIAEAKQSEDLLAAIRQCQQ